MSSAQKSLKRALNFSLILLFFISSSFAYGPKDIRLSSYSFNRYVRPQLMSIVHDYETLLMTLNPQFSSLPQFNDLFKSLDQEASKLKKSCAKKEVLICTQNLNQILTYLKSVIKLLDKSSPSFFQHQSTQNPNILLKTYQHFYQLRSHIIQLHFQVDHTNFIKEMKLAPPDLYGLESSLNEAKQLFHLFLIETSDERFKNHFLNFWNDFIRPIAQNILPHNNQKLFEAKLRELNLSLNFLHIILTKRNHKITKQVETIFKTIHRRWNSILKVTLKR